MQRIAFGPFVFEPARGVLLCDGRPMPVNQKGIRLLAALLEAPGETVSKTELMNAAWSRAAIEESNLSVQIAALRKLLGAAHDGGEWIATVPRVGYRFVGSVSGTDAPAETVDPSEGRPLIAVLPFGIVSEEGGKEYLADGITDDIITALARYRWFRVVVRGSAFAQRDKTVYQLGARYALQGNVRHSGEQLRISAQLIDTRDGTHLWVDRYNLAMADVFAIQDAIAERVVGAIEPELLKTESRQAIVRHTGNMTAWDLVRQGMWHFHKVTPEGHRAARELFRRACGSDPNLSEAHAWLGRVSAGIIAYGWSDDVVADGREGTQAATRAVALDSRDPYAHYSFAIVSCYAGSANTGALAAQSAIDLNPSFALGHLVLGMARLFDGEAARAIVPLRYGLELNPNDPQNVAWQILLAYSELLSDMPDKAFESANRALALRPVFGPTFKVLCCCAVALGQHDEARQWKKRLRDVDGPEGYFIEPIRARQPKYDEQIARLLQKVNE